MISDHWFGQRSEVRGDAPDAAHSDFRIPTSDVEITDAVFARLDERAGELTDSVWDEDTDEEDRQDETNEAMLWSWL